MNKYIEMALMIAVSMTTIIVMGLAIYLVIMKVIYRISETEYEKLIRIDARRKRWETERLPMLHKKSLATPRKDEELPGATDKLSVKDIEAQLVKMASPYVE